MRRANAKHWRVRTEETKADRPRSARAEPARVRAKRRTTSSEAELRCLESEVDKDAERDQHDTDQEERFLARARRAAARDRPADHREPAGWEHPDDEEQAADDVVRAGDATGNVTPGSPRDKRAERADCDCGRRGRECEPDERFAHADP